MNDDPTPLEPAELDELLSAELDGELDAAALDFGSSADELRARIRVTPLATERLAALDAARALLREPPAIDELLAARLRAKAVRAAAQAHAAQLAVRRRRRYRAVGVAGGIAAAVVATVAIAAGISGRSDETKAASAPGQADAHLAAPRPAASATTPRSIASGELGEFTDTHALALAAVDVSIANSPSNGATLVPSAPPAAATTGKSAKKSVGAPTTVSGADYGRAQDAVTGAVPSSSAPAGQCPKPPQVPDDVTLILRARASLSGRPVHVLVFAGNGEHVVSIQDAGCVLVNLQMLG